MKKILLFTTIILIISLVTVVVQAQPSSEWRVIKKMAIEKGRKVKDDTLAHMMNLGSVIYYFGYDGEKRIIEFAEVNVYSKGLYHITAVYYYEQDSSFEMAVFGPDKKLIEKISMPYEQGLEAAQLFLRDLVSIACSFPGHFLLKKD